MSGKMKSHQRETSNPTGGIILDVNEKILKNCYELYSTKETGKNEYNFANLFSRQQHNTV